MQNCSNSIANALELLQSCTKPSMYAFNYGHHQCWCIKPQPLSKAPDLTPGHLYVSILMTFKGRSGRFCSQQPPTWFHPLMSGSRKLPFPSLLPRRAALQTPGGLGKVISPPCHTCVDQTQDATGDKSKARRSNTKSWRLREINHALVVWNQYRLVASLYEYQPSQ